MPGVTSAQSAMTEIPLGSGSGGAGGGTAGTQSFDGGRLLDGGTGGTTSRTAATAGATDTGRYRSLY